MRKMPEFYEGSEMGMDEHMSNVNIEVQNINLSQVLEIVKQKKLEKDEYWYLIDKKWFEQCEQFIHDQEPTHNPGPIDNCNLFESVVGGMQLKGELQDELDYKLIPEEAWHMLVAYFGIQDEKFIIKRLVIEQGCYSTCCMVEVYPIELKLCHGSNKVVKHYSQSTTLHELEDDMKQIFKVDPTRDTQIYLNNILLNPHRDKDHKKFDNQSLCEASVCSGNNINLEVRNEDGTWPLSRSYTTRSSGGKKSQSPGLCGLQNLGNTCFMNSALQCLSNTPPLTEFIISDKYLDEINKENPLGMRGEVIKTYGELIKNMWSGRESSVAPREFKFAVGRFASQFSGYAQEDCQELMSFLLDGLHEDLNRIKNKPYIEMKTDVDTRPDHVVAQESWENYKKRNDSIIVDTFHGLLKSTLVCPDCHLVSVTFDPFCYLSLPLPEKREQQINAIFVPAYTKSKEVNENDIRAVTFNRISIPKYGFVRDICSAVAKVINHENRFSHKIDPLKLLVTEVYNHRFYKVYENDDAIPTITDKVVIYEMLNGKFSIPVYWREVKPDEAKTLFGRPFLIEVNNPNFDTIYEAVNNQLKRFMQVSVCGESSGGIAECDDGGAELFSLSLTNIFGTIDLEILENNSSIELINMNFLAVNIPTSFKTKYYDPYELEDTYKVNVPKSSRQAKSIPLLECLMNFTTTEKLGADDPWYCPTCKTHQQATKKFDLWDLPNVLIIHLKRFSYSRYWRDKLDTMVDFPVSALNMGEYVINNPDKKPILYDLIAVANHFGGLGGGHYTAYAKNSQTQRWYNFNDSSVTPASEEGVVSQQAYVLYYLKRTET